MMQQPDVSKVSRDSGFTLLEILVVVAILGLLVLQVGPAVLRQFGGARASVAKQSVEQLAGVLDLYKLGVGSYPTTDQGLLALNTPPGGVTGWEGPYLKGDAQPLDPWNHAYLYRNPSTRPGHEFDLCSRGPNNQAGEAGPDLICNR